MKVIEKKVYCSICRKKHRIVGGKCEGCETARRGDENAGWSAYPYIIGPK